MFTPGHLAAESEGGSAGKAGPRRIGLGEGHSETWREEQKLKARSWVEEAGHAIFPTHSGAGERIGIPNRPSGHGFRTAELVQSLDLISFGHHETEDQPRQLMRTHGITVAGPGEPQLCPSAQVSMHGPGCIINPIYIDLCMLWIRHSYRDHRDDRLLPTTAVGGLQEFNWSGEVSCGLQTAGSI